MIVNNDYDGLQNHTVLTGKSKNSKETTMRMHLARFLTAYPCFQNTSTSVFPTSFEELPAIAFDDSCVFLGKFSNFIFSPATPTIKKMFLPIGLTTEHQCSPTMET